MGIQSKCRRVSVLALIVASLSAAAIHADEIRLKDGKKLYGVIVGYDDNMFKVKTDFGYVLVEKDKIAQIIPSSSGPNEAAKAPASTPAPAQPAAATPKPSTDTTPKIEPAVETTTTNPASGPSKRDKTAAVITHVNARPEIPTATPVALEENAPALKAPRTVSKSALATATAPPPPPQEEPRPVSEEIQGNLYINHEYGFHMYKAPSWQIIEGAGQTLPNAIVAMGTSNESTLMVIGREKTKEPLESAAATVEKRMRDVYENYRLISERKTVVGGQPAIEYHYRGMADTHDWSGTLVVVSRGADIFTILGMTFADTDLIQIQENVIARSIASVDLNSK
ncbi:MAG TPA: hypothetical protein VKH45_14275 [Candidatus Acidoferrum sp.]|nr:hypothetical protein [Candidatus Acidoferrum sp.]